VIILILTHSAALIMRGLGTVDADGAVESRRPPFVV
jgi:hypothetical protein